MAQALIFVLVILVFGIHDAEAQRFRGGMGGGNRLGAAGQISIRSPHGFSQAGGFIVQRAPGTFVRIVPLRHQLVRVVSGPVFVTPVAPFFSRFRPPFVAPFFPRRGGILLINVPSVIGTTVVAQPAPEVTYLDPSMSDVGQPQIQGRLALQVAPFDPSPQAVVERMLALAEIKKGDVVYDLGSGDGRVVITAAKKYGVRAVGYEIDPGLVKLARENVRKEGLGKLVEIRQQDFMTADLSPASVVTLYLSSDGNLALKPALMNQLKPGARIVSYAFDMTDWTPQIIETYRDAGGDSHLLYLWQISEPQHYSENSSSVQ
jgi:precorrin-6B methylase 2